VGEEHAAHPHHRGQHVQGFQQSVQRHWTRSFSWFARRGGTLYPDARIVERSRMTTPLAGITVLDFGQIYQGPYATMLMAKAGANVIKIEPPHGEPARRSAA